MLDQLDTARTRLKADTGRPTLVISSRPALGRCPACSRTVGHHALECPRCGAELAGDEAGRLSRGVRNQPRAVGRLPRWLFALGLLLVSVSTILNLALVMLCEYILWAATRPDVPSTSLGLPVLLANVSLYLGLYSPLAWLFRRANTCLKSWGFVFYTFAHLAFWLYWSAVLFAAFCEHPL